MNNFFDILKKVLLVIILVCIFLLLVSFILFIISYKINPNENHEFFFRENLSIRNILPKSKYRNPIGLEYKKKPIILFGDAYTYGYMLDDKETVAAHLSENTKRPVYNQAVLGGGIQHAILNVQNDSIDDVIKESDIAIYFLSSIKDNINLRVYPGPAAIDPHFLLDSSVYPRYILDKNNDLIFYIAKHPCISESIIARYIKKIYFSNKLNFIYNRKFKKNKDLDFDILHFKKLQTELKNINPNIKLVVFFFWDTPSENNKYYFDELEKLGITVIDRSKLHVFENMEELNDAKYITEDGNVPSSETWSIIVPKIVTILNLK